ncbi:cadherin-like protein 26 [Oryzias melastigma]|uniref:cadherin-like protein 26 n=1 Tax=Oryzias melastigma TaxID=30732 RepID=UPI000CF82046|nr:cadherin-like protein 26 [Oryzias melastigma]
MDIRHLSFLSLFWGVQSSFAGVLLRHKRNWIIDTFTIDEAYTGPFPYNVGKIAAENNYTNFEIHGQGVDLEPFGLLSINSYSGTVTVQDHVDCEKFEGLKVKFKAQKRESKEVIQLGVLIIIKDSNDNPPRFSQDLYEIRVNESTLQGFDLIRLQVTDADRSEENNNFTLRIVSVDPKPHDLEFYLKEVRTIGFKGCLDYEKANKYTITVEAKDSGNPKPLSSTCKVIINIEDGNNNLPVITKQTNSRKVKEGEKDVLVSRLQVKDEDSKGTKAWKAKYHIHGDTDNNFRITTDPDTNEGLLFVQKPLDYEDEPVKNLTITVENEIPYFSCKVVEKRSGSLWKTEVITQTSYTGATYESDTNKQQHSHSFRVTVDVEDINEPPVFGKQEKEISMSENDRVGKYLETFTAIDRDVTSSKEIRYLKGKDPANWVTVDPISGTLKTLSNLDRESPFVTNGVYVVTICAVDDGEPPQTSTATLSIYITDENDNLPYLAVNRIDMCLSDKPSLSNITALDLDGDPYSGPFGFNLLGDVKDKWRVEPELGYSVNLVKEGNVHSGFYNLLLEVSDVQGKAAVHNLTVTVCDCLNPKNPNCMTRKATTFTIRRGFLAIFLFSMVLFAGILLFSFVISCKKEKVPFPFEFSEQLLMPSNTEEPGTDCMVTLPPRLKCGKTEQTAVKSQDQTVLMKQASVVNCSAMATTAVNSGSSEKSSEFQSQTPCLRSIRRPSLQIERAAPNLVLLHHQRKPSIDGSVHQQRKNSKSVAFTGCHQKGFLGQNVLYQEIVLKKALMTMTANQKASGEELCDYEPHVYTEEGDSEHNYDLDVISITEDSSDTDWDLDSRFSTLASICMPSSITGTKTFNGNADH